MRLPRHPIPFFRKARNMARRAGKRSSSHRWNAGSGPFKYHNAPPDQWRCPLPDEHRRRAAKTRIQRPAVASCRDCTWRSQQETLLDNRAAVHAEEKTWLGAIPYKVVLADHQEAWTVIRSTSLNNEAAIRLRLQMDHHEHQSGHPSFLVVGTPAQARQRIRHRPRRRTTPPGIQPVRMEEWSEL